MNISVQLALLGLRVLDLEQVCEVGVGVQVDAQLRRLRALVADQDLLRKSRADGPLSHDRELRVDVDGARSGHEEELHLVVLKVVGGEYVRNQAVDRQDPAGQKPRIPGEQPFGVAEGRVDVAGPIADDEVVAFEDADRLTTHAATGTRRRKSIARARSPESLTRPCRNAVITFCRPSTISMKSATEHSIAQSGFS